jgi:hypothetical protein
MSELMTLVPLIVIELALLTGCSVVLIDDRPPRKPPKRRKAK